MTTVQRTVLLGTMALLFASVAGATIAPATALASTTVQILADVGGCFVGHQPTSGDLTVTWTDTFGQTKADFSTTASISSGWRPPLAACQNHVVAFGDLIHVHVTSPDDVTHDFRIRQISGVFHRATNLVRGTTPLGGDVFVAVGRPSIATSDIPKMCSFLPTRDSAGTFTVDTTNCVPGYDAIGGDAAVVSWNTPGGDFERLFVRAPFVEAVLRKAKVDGYLDAGTSASLSLRSSTGQVRGASTVTASSLTGAFEGAFRKNRLAVKAWPGTVIRGSWEGPHTYRVRQLVIAISPTAISGTCDPATLYGLALLRGGSIVANGDGVTDATGTTDLLNLSESGLNSGDVVAFTCVSGGGDRTMLTRVVD